MVRSRKRTLRGDFNQAVQGYLSLQESNLRKEDKRCPKDVKKATGSAKENGMLSDHGICEEASRQQEVSVLLEDHHNNAQSRESLKYFCLPTDKSANLLVVTKAINANL